MTVTWWRTDAIEWQAHGWSLEVRGDEIAEIRHHDQLVLRAVRPAVRDRGWRTVPVTVHRLDRDVESLVLHLQHEGLGARVTSTLTVSARPGELALQWSARSEVDFDTCRTGLVALHPPSEAGRAVEVTHPDGSARKTTFPLEISPHQPIQDIRSLRFDEGTTISFEGDVFEMEDQRNWTDASFKTYSRPLDLPFPYPLSAGEPVRQAITITAVGASSMSAAKGIITASIIDLVEGGPFPAVGVEASTAPDPVPSSSVGAFRVVELDLRTPSWRAALDRAARDCLPLTVHLVSDGDQQEMKAATAALAGLPVLRLAAFDAESHITTPQLAALARVALEDAGLMAPLASGARSHFTELNRGQSSIAQEVDALALTTTPLFHTLDTEQLIEAVAMQRLVAEQSVRIAAGLAVHIGPVSLRPRFNNVATLPELLPARADLSEGYGAEFTGSVDGRQRAPELAAWVIASAAALAVPGVHSLAWFETWGPRGLADASGPLPAAIAVDALVELGGSTLLSGTSPDGLVWAIGGRDDAQDVVLAANLDHIPRVVDVRTPGERQPRRLKLSPGSWTRSPA